METKKKKNKKEMLKVLILKKEIIEKVAGLFEKSEVDKHAKISALYMAVVDITSSYLESPRFLACYFMANAVRQLGHMIEEDDE